MPPSGVGYLVNHCTQSLSLKKGKKKLKNLEFYQHDMSIDVHMVDEIFCEHFFPLSSQLRFICIGSDFENLTHVGK